MPYAIRSLIGLSIGLVFSLLLTMFLAPGRTTLSQGGIRFTMASRN